ncbi:MAG TPA: aminodeoxychorismate lyase [Aliiroseovarius sp.]|nr:aminodeoxychorismate lyase [Aliiroseovarius sp.]
MKALVNGRENTNPGVFDRGLAYGDGLFETMAVLEGRCPFWDRHLRRLRRGCEALRLPLPDPALLRDEAQRLIGAESRAVLKLILTRGEGGRGYRHPGPVQATRILMRLPWPDYPPQNGQQGVQARFCETRLARQPALAGLKHLNRLEQVLARNEWQDPAIAEGLMLDEQENVIEGTMSNLFMVHNDTLYTPDLSACGVAGIMRERILELAAAEGIRSVIEPIAKSRLLAAEEIFLSNSLIGLWPVTRLADRVFAAGPVSRALQAHINRDYGLS